ncbi:hypothetical protein TB2_023951 [Malus domestica]
MAIHDAKCDNKWSDTTTTSFHHGNHRGGSVVRSMVPSPRPEPCHPKLTILRPQPKPNTNSTCCQAEPKPRTHVHHTLRSLLSPSNPLLWPSLLPPSSPLLWPSLLQPCNLISWPSLFPWPSKQPKSIQD